MLNANSIGKGSKLDLFLKFIHNFCHCPKELPLALTTALPLRRLILLSQSSKSLRLRDMEGLYSQANSTTQLSR